MQGNDIFGESTLDNSELDKIISRVPKKRLGTTYEVARIAAFLADLLQNLNGSE